MNRMKSLSRLALFLMGAALSLPPMAKADTTQQRVFSGKGTAQTTNLSYYVLSAKFAPARVEYLSVQSADSAGLVRFWQATGNSITITNALVAGLSNILTQTTNGLAAGDVVVLRDVTNDQYQRCKVVTTAASGIVITNEYTTTATTSFPLAVGDEVWRMTQVGQIPIATLTPAQVGGVGATNNIVPAGLTALFNTQEGRPGIVDVGVAGTGLSTNNVLNLISGSYGRGVQR